MSSPIPHIDPEFLDPDKGELDLLALHSTDTDLAIACALGTQACYDAGDQGVNALMQCAKETAIKILQRVAPDRQPAFEDGLLRQALALAAFAADA